MDLDYVILEDNEKIYIDDQIRINNIIISNIINNNIIDKKNITNSNIIINNIIDKYIIDNNKRNMVKNIIDKNITRNDNQHDVLINKITILNNQIIQLKHDYNEILAKKACSNTLCCACMTNPNNQVNTACGHMSVCGTCLEKINNTCPICRRFGNYIQVYNSGV